MDKISYKVKNFYYNTEIFSNKIVVVSGGARGIGAEISKRFALGGATVIIADIAEELLKKTVSDIKSAYGLCDGISVDVTHWKSVQTMVDQCITNYGKIDILINNAGTIHPAEYLSMSEYDWDFLLAVDLKGVVSCSQSVAPHMIRQQYGRIINISSMSALGVYMPGFSNYSAAKAAVNDFTKASARELGRHGITVNAVAPGEIMTELTYKDQTDEEVSEKLKRSKAMAMVGRIGEPEDVANLVCFLASDMASFITGEIISVDGGRIDRM